MKDTNRNEVELDLDLARENYLAEQAKDYPSASVKYNYAKALTRDAKRDNKMRGIGLLESKTTPLGFSIYHVGNV
jgi:hypothetical protein